MDIRDEMKKYNVFKYSRVSPKEFQEMVEKLVKIYESKRIKSESNKI